MERWWHYRQKIKRTGLNKVTAKFMAPYLWWRRKYPEHRWTDTFVVFFPKSGRTWIRVFLSGYFHERYGVAHRLDFAPVRKIASDVPRIGFTHGGSVGQEIAEIVAGTKKLRNKNVVLIVRDPRDVLISYYYEMKFRDPNRSGNHQVQSMSLSEFLRDTQYGIKHIVSCMNVWLDATPSFSSVSVIRYEDLRTKPQDSFKTLLDTLGVTSVDDTAYQSALTFSSFENMRKLEQQDFFADPRLRPTNTADKNSFKTRKGKVGGYRDELSEEDIKYADEVMKSLDDYFGYGV